MLELTLIRHGETEFNRRGRYQGSASDPELTAEGEAQARRLGRRLCPIAPQIDAVWTSDLLRARRTAELALPALRARPDRRLRELDFGEFDGGSYQDNLARHGPEFTRWLNDPWLVAPPGAGETLGQLRTRLFEWLAELPRNGRIVAFSHAGPIQLLSAELLGIAFHEAQRFRLEPCGCITLDIRKNGSVTTTFSNPE